MHSDWPFGCSRPPACMLTPSIISLDLPAALMPPSGTALQGMPLQNPPARHKGGGPYFACIWKRVGPTMVKATFDTIERPVENSYGKMCRTSSIDMFCLSHLRYLGATCCCDGAELWPESHLIMPAQALRLEDAELLDSRLCTMFPGERDGDYTGAFLYSSVLARQSGMQAQVLASYEQYGKVCGLLRVPMLPRSSTICS